VNHKEILEGIEWHKRGENAIDPPTGREMPPPSGWGADEETGSFLDNFSQREIERYLAGSHSAVKSMWPGNSEFSAACAVGSTAQRRS